MHEIFTLVIRFWDQNLSLRRADLLQTTKIFQTPWRIFFNINLRPNQRYSKISYNPQIHHGLHKALEIDVCFHRGPVLGNMEGRSFLRAFKIRMNYLFYQENFYKEFERHVKEGSGNGHSPHRGPHWGT